MKKETLDAMIDAMMSYRPHFANYLKEKSKLPQSQKWLTIFMIYSHLLGN